jgi:hypothetical protein
LLERNVYCAIEREGRWGDRQIELTGLYLVDDAENNLPVVEFGQYAVRTAGRTINLVSRDALPDFDPTANRGGTFAAITGTLRHFSPLGPERGYILEPRCEEDLAASMGEVLPSYAACVSPRTGGPVEVE